jgi:hypothetical protein
VAVVNASTAASGEKKKKEEMEKSISSPALVAMMMTLGAEVRNVSG